jgi:hypothetical protein
MEIKEIWVMKIRKNHQVKFFLVPSQGYLKKYNPGKNHHIEDLKN